jgi:HEAT repeat protein
MLLTRKIDEEHQFSILLSKLKSMKTRKNIGVDDLSVLFLENAKASEIGSFEELAGSASGEVRHAALRAIRKIGDAGTTPFLIQELDSSDPICQYTALITLAEIHHKTGEYGPGLGSFESDKARYVKLWKEWFYDSQR